MGSPSPIRDVGPRMKGDIMSTTRKDKDTLRLGLLKRIVRCPLFRSKGRQDSSLLFTRVIAWIFAVVVIRGIFNQMQTIGQEIQAQGSPPTPEQETHMHALVARLGREGQVSMVFLVIALLGMSIARYIPF